jgi:hypothetical protein
VGCLVPDLLCDSAVESGDIGLDIERLGDLFEGRSIKARLRED